MVQPSRDPSAGLAFSTTTTPALSRAPYSTEPGARPLGASEPPSHASAGNATATAASARQATERERPRRRVRGGDGILFMGRVGFMGFLLRRSW